MPQDYVVVPQDRSMLAVIKLSVDTPRGAAFKHAAHHLRGMDTDRIESYAYDFNEAHGITFHSYGLGEIGDPYPLTMQGSKVVSLALAWRAMTDKDAVLISGYSNLLRQLLGSFFQTFKYIDQQKNFAGVDWSLISEGFVDMIQFVLNELPTTRGINDQEES